MLERVARLDGRRDDADPRSRWKLRQALEGLEVHLRKEREHRDPQTVQTPLHLREMRKGRDRSDPLTPRSLPSDGRRHVPEEHFAARTGR